MTVARTADHRHCFRRSRVFNDSFYTVPGCCRRRQSTFDLLSFGVHLFCGPQFQVIVIVATTAAAAASTWAATASVDYATAEFAFDPLRYVQSLSLVARAVLGHPLTSLVHQRRGKRLEIHRRHTMQLDFWFLFLAVYHNVYNMRVTCTNMSSEPFKCIQVLRIIRTSYSMV